MNGRDTMECLQRERREGARDVRGREENYNCVTVENIVCVVAVLMYTVVG